MHISKKFYGSLVIQYNFLILRLSSNQEPKINKRQCILSFCFENLMQKVCIPWKKELSTFAKF